MAKPEEIKVPVSGHRADIVHDGWVIELQHSPISPAEIREREDTYGKKMMWLFDGTDLGDRLVFLRKRSRGVTFRWKPPRKSYAFCRRPCLIDLGDRVLRMRKLHLDEPPYYGWGVLKSRLRMQAWLATCARSLGSSLPAPHTSAAD